MGEDEEARARWSLDTGIVCNPVLISLGFRVNEFNEDSINIWLGLLAKLQIEQNTKIEFNLISN